MLEYLVHFVDALQGKVWAAPVFVTTYSLVCLTGPITPFPVIAGVLFGVGKGFVWSLAAELAGACLAFYLGRLFGHRFLAKRLGGRYARLEAAMSGEDGFRAILVMRLVGFPPFTLVNYAAGMAGVTWKSFMAATLLGILPWTLLMAYFSKLLWAALLEGGWRGFRRAIVSHGGEYAVFGVLLAAFFAGQWIWKRRVKRRISGKA